MKTYLPILKKEHTHYSKFHTKLFRNRTLNVGANFWTAFSIKVSKFQNEFMKSTFLPKYEPNIAKISALLHCATLQGRNPYNFWFIFCEKWWLHKFILKITDLQQSQGSTPILFIPAILSLAGNSNPIYDWGLRF